MTKQTDNGIDEIITHVELENGVNAGIRWRTLGNDMVPLFEEHSARLERKIGIEDWYKMDTMERAMVIAVRRIDNASKNHQAEAEIKKAKRDAARR